MKQLRTEAEALCRAVAPELNGRPLYVVLASDVYTDPGNGDGPDGCTMRHLDLMLRPTLERLGRWSGRGPAMVLDPRSIARTAERRIRPARRRVFAPAALGVAIHELADVLAAEPDEAEPSAENVEAGRAMLTADADGTDAPTNGPGAAVPWRGHEWAFIRAALHLAHRAAALGVDLTPRDIFDAETYGLAPTGRYVSALGDEPERLAGGDFATIARTPPPAFAELWLADVRRWLERPDTRDEMVTMLARCAHRITIPKRERDFMLTEMLTELELRRKDRDADFLKLAAAVELATQRFAWHEARQNAAALEKHEPAIRDLMDAERRKLEAAEKAHEEAMAPLRARLHEIRAAVSAASHARRKLIKTCPYATIKAEMKALTDRLNELRGQVAALRDRGELVKRAERDEETADRLQAGIVPFANTAHIDRLREQAERHRMAGKDALAALATVQKEIAKLEREEAAIFERMTKP